jgi:hypothetical protein
MPINFTHGGLPETRALHWNEATYQKLGHIVFLLNSVDPRERQTGYCEFFAMRRMFMLNEWDDQIKRIDAFRAEKGHKEISEIVNDSRRQLVDFGRMMKAYPENPAMPDAPVSEVYASSLKLVACEGQQLNLF